ncbi:hypothetical protein HU200_015719 [Digitaria exilis]|uniref:Ribosome-inactivating protein n=1 Tax=Digitaria exilis TaxID=1010633 RepID=A0A835F930_9POAL|nr:hypothetical protein HU200_015719 [Digitaria exilis]CAB3456174.1 unnamed protein product [Digitaria exilis]
MKGGTLQAFLMLLNMALAPWLCLASSSAPLLLSSDTTTAAAALRDYPQVQFSTASATPETYNAFITAVRAALVSESTGQSNGIPVLPAIATYLNVTLTNKAGYAVSLKMDVTGAFFTAYEAGKASCLLKRSPSGGAFSSATCYVDPWALTSASASPELVAGDDLGGSAATATATATWKAKDLDEAVSSLYLYPTGNATEKKLSAAVSAIDVMIASAATFPYVQRRVSAGMRDGNGVSDDGSLQTLRSRWPTLSAAVQESFQGSLAVPVSIQRSNGAWITVDNVRTAAPLVSFLQHDDCKTTTSSSSSSSSSSSQSQFPMVIRSVVEEEAESTMVAGVGAPAKCSKAEPTVRIVGPEGRCVDVPYNWYYSGSQVQLWSCKSTADVNQLWTFKRDGTIRSNGWCLVTSGSRVVVDDCNKCTASSSVWEVRADGTIALKSTGLVLAVTSSSAFAPVTVRKDDRGTGQSWTPTNVTSPVTAPVVGYGDLCLQVDFAGAVSLAACGGDGVAWSLYPDGSLRPPAWLFLQWRCLAADASGKVAVKYCDGSGSACERWVFRSDGTILNTGTGMVLDATPSKSKRGCYDVVVSKATGSATQQWALML